MIRSQTNSRCTQTLMASLLLVALNFLVVPTANAQSSDTNQWPRKAVKLIVPYPTGGISDNVARLVAERLTKVLGQPVLVENRAGAGGTLGTAAVLQSPADGYTIGLAGASAMTLGPHVMKVSYDPIKDVAPIGTAMYSPIYLVATPKFAGKSFAEIITASKAKPGSVSVATNGYGTVGHIMLEQLRKKAGVDIIHIPYKGGGQVVTDAVGGQFDLMFSNPFGSLNGLISEGKLRVVAVGAPTRVDSFPNIPTLAELGYPEANQTSFFGFFAPAGTPVNVIARLNAELNKILAEPEIKEKIRAGQNLVVTGTPEEFTKMIQLDYASNAKIIKEAKIKSE